MAPEANLYLKHVPPIDISAEPGKGLKRRLVGIAAWDVVAAVGLKMAGLA